jgi:hypothetical protein
MPEEAREVMEYKETNLALRHFSNMRFAFVSIFGALNGAMLVGLDKGLRDANRFFVAAAVLGLAIVFWRLEWLLNRYIDALRDHAKQGIPNSYWEKVPLSNPHYVTRTVRCFYIATVIFWVALATMASVRT